MTSAAIKNKVSDGIQNQMKKARVLKSAKTTFAKSMTKGEEMMTELKKAMLLPEPAKFEPGPIDFKAILERPGKKRKRVGRLNTEWMDYKQVDKAPEMGVPNIRYEERVDRAAFTTQKEVGHGAGKQLWKLLTEEIFKLPMSKKPKFADEQLCKEWQAKKANDEQ